MYYTPRLLSLVFVGLLAAEMAAQDSTRVFQRIDRLTEIALASEPADSPLHPAFQDRNEVLRQEIRDSVYLFDPVLLPYLDSLTRRIQLANGLDTSGLILMDYTAESNAHSLGTGVVVINLGLLLSLRYEEELQFVLCHELAHDQLGHRAASIRQSGAQSAEMMRTIRKLSRPAPMRGKRRERALHVDLRNQYYGAFRNKREAELAADSLALVYYRRLGSPIAFAASALDDTPGPVTDSVAEDALVNLLATPEQPLDPDWLRDRPRLFGGANFGSRDEGPRSTFWQADSLQTHPAHEERQAGLQAALKLAGVVDYSPVGKPLPARSLLYRRLAEGEMQREAYGPALVLALHLLREEPDNQELRELSGQALYGVYRSAVDHAFDAAVPPAAYFGSAASRHLIGMLRRMTTEQLRDLTAAYLAFAAPACYAGARAQL